MIEFLPYGNVTVFALILAAVLLAAVLVNQVALLVGRIALSLDDENAPKILESNWLWSNISKLISVELYYAKWYSEGYGSTLGLLTSTWFTEGYWSKYTKSQASKLKTTEVVSCGKGVSPSLLTHYVGALLLVDLAILWLQHHFLSAVWVLSTVGIVLTLRFITGKLWNHNKRITTLEER